MESNPLGEMILLHTDEVALHLKSLEDSSCLQACRTLDVGFPDPSRTLFTRKRFCTMCALVLNVDMLNPELFGLGKTPSPSV